jgi:transglutaminase-like putative cysteine protease
MRYHITHSTRYQYDRPVRLEPHTIRLWPRQDGSQMVREFAIAIHPHPVIQTQLFDLDGNICVRAGWGDQTITLLTIETTTDIETLRQNPFDYWHEPWANHLPLDYPASLALALNPYLSPFQQTFHPTVVALAHQIAAQAHHQVGYFLTQLNQTLYERFTYEKRTLGAAQSAHVTLAQNHGTCRDFAVVFIEVCRAIGLAARFVSGYQEGDLSEHPNEHDLHAWAEVYVPGGGWRGFDPTLGLAVADRHVPLAAAATPQGASPVSGQLAVGYQAIATLETHIRLSTLQSNSA